jgi:hypothetical protein
MLEEVIDSLGVKMERKLRSSGNDRQSWGGTTRTMIATAFAVWALLLQSLLPVAGALASDSGNAFLIELCTTAGIQTIAIDGDEGAPERPLQSKTGSGCDVCVGCGCARSAASCCGTASLPGTSWSYAAWSLRLQRETGLENVSGFRSRAPPVA